jgi:integrase
MDESKDAVPGDEWIQVFESWIAAMRSEGRLRRTSSVAVYRAMWQALGAWCTAQDPAISPNALDKRTLLDYAAARESRLAGGAAWTPRYRWRLFNLVDRIERHRASSGAEPASGDARRLIVGDPLLRRANADAAQALPDHLAPDEARRLVVLLAALRRADVASSAQADWQRWRNRAAVGLQLGGGLTPGEVRALRLTHVVRAGSPSLPRRLRVPALAGTPAHETPLAAWAAQLLQGWLDLRHALGIPGDWVFVATRGGRAWGKVAQYEAARSVLAESGIETARAGGSFRLRHTFALRALKHGHPPHQVAQWLGVVDPTVIERYRRALAAIDDELD